ncbi:threonine/homoserine/homoserine lactone efflux protein [Nocardia transvalensis]|uniref:Threonine/homoserine/homoserine lactone efflux protein n=1 Tax=Nocardia transvalensis TaxID=37333 RepID=A0A7W9P903_9NOCA|nr:LysE family translocator [Nocardia transvalensis]MBB5911711.1 threonine/homoserine/homoserine lactone efflux protein [Nocardia transvalensis]
MVPLSHIAAFAVAALIIIVIPGPNVLFAIGRALTLGRRSAVLSVVGGVAGSFVPLVAVSVGLGAVLMASATLFLILKIVGAAYLIYLGVTAIRQRKKLAEALRSKVPSAGGGLVIRQGFIVGATNPKTIVFFGAVLPQFAVPDQGALPAQFLTLGTVFLAIQALSDGTWALLAATARSWFVRSPRRLETVGGTGGLMIIGVGAGMALSGPN